MNIISNKLVRSIIVVASGTVGAQIIAFLFVPIITRLYGPVQYGELGAFLSLINIFLPIVTMGYGAAIVLPKTSRQVKGLIQLSFIISISFAFLIFMIGFVVIKNTNIIGDRYPIISDYLFIIPLLLLISAFNEVGLAFLQRLKKFKNIAASTVTHATINYGGQAFIGLFYPVSISLIFTHVMSLAIKSILVFRMGKIDIISGYNWKVISYVAIRYKDFPLYRAPQLLLNAFSQSVPVLILAYFFSPGVVGYYSLARFSLAVPISLLGRSVSSVFYPHFNELFLQRKPIYKVLAKATLNLACIGIIPFGTVIIYGSELFELVFGSDWSVAGSYAGYMSLWLYFALVNLPCVSIIPVIKAQSWYLKYEVCSLIFRALAMVITINYTKDAITAILIFSLVGVAVNSYLIFKIHSKAKVFDNDFN